ncbi:MAG: type I methionyl aminopeptidase [Oscillospiraceae bacterium]|jgi:methionyl aminopeptidase|nr:type I methionyl aminopeptidase [Oscillospiraceae bacterium]
MVYIKTKQEIEKMKIACGISANALRIAGEAVEPGVSTLEIDDIVEKYIKSQGAVSSFLNYNGYPNSSCISVNDVVIHGIPQKDCILRQGDIVSIDVGAFFDGFHGDNAYTFACGDISKEAKRLLEVTKQSLLKGIENALSSNYIGDISSTVQQYVESNGCSVVRSFCGHGVGHNLHEKPNVPNYGKPKKGFLLQPGLTIAIEPMVNLGGCDVKILPDGWTTVTEDGSLSAHFEHTIAITEDSPIILTVCS